MNPGLELNSRHDGEENENEEPGCLMQLTLQRLLLPGSLRLKGPV